jgi:hypothetical protein
MSDYTEEEQAEAEAREADEEAKGPRQSITREPAGAAGPFFPSGMSAQEAAMAGATANLSDDDKAKIEDMKAEYGLTPAEEVEVEEEP